MELLGYAKKFRSDLMNIAMTTLSSKILSRDKDHFAELAVDAVMRLKGSANLEAIQIIKKLGGSLKDSFLDEGNGGHMSVWDHQILIQIGILECEALNTLLSCGVCGRKVAQYFCIGEPTAMRRQQ